MLLHKQLNFFKAFACLPLVSVHQSLQMDPFLLFKFDRLPDSIHVYTLLRHVQELLPFGH